MSYSRRFIILNKFDEKYCNEGATGYCKIDTQDDKSRVTVFVQGLKDAQDETEYCIYLISFSKGQFAAAFLGNTALQKGTGEFYFDVDTKNVCKVGLQISQFDLVALCVKNKKSTEQSEIPLVGYYDAPLDRTWRSYFIGSLKPDNRNSEIKEMVTTDRPEVKDEPDQPVRPAIGNNYTEFLKKGNIREINEALNGVRGVSEYNPFEKVKLKYKWWKVANESFLENILKFNVASSQVFKHPLIKKLLKQSNHCLFGIVSDAGNKTRFIAFGFPAEYSMKDQLYIGGFANFYPSAGYNKRKGDHGYWVVHIRMDDGSISMTV